MTEKKKPVKKPAAKRKPAARKKAAPEFKVLDKVTEYKVGTKEYCELVVKHNELYNTHWNPNRVRPAVLYGIYAKLKERFGK